MLPDNNASFCSEHRHTLAEHDRRLAVLETVIGNSADDGLRGLMARLADQLQTLNSCVQALQLAQARATGAFDGASWMGRALWAVVGAATAAGAMGLIHTGAK